MSTSTATHGEITIAAAEPSDLEDVLALLGEVGLPTEGVAAYFGDFLVARDASGRLVGCAGLERHETVGLVRSVAVSPSLQCGGLGSRLTARLLAHASDAGLERVVLLTTTARKFFVERFGFCEADRAGYETRLAGSPEWTLPRCSSAAFLELDLSTAV